MTVLDKQISRVREKILSCSRPLFLFDDDPDGLASFLLLYRMVRSGKGIPLKGRALDNGFVEKVNEYRMMKTQIKKMGYKDRKKIMGGVGMRDYIFQQTGVSQKTEHQLSFVEQNNPKLAEMVLTGEISIKRAYQEIKKIDSPNGIDIKKDLDDLEVLLKKLYPNVEYSQMEKILKRIFGKD